jgi:peptidoglycan/xylan/chitin deacetylase (PgdA/CDA1 family)
MRPLALLCLLAFTALSAAEDKVVIWKLDDVKAGEKKRLAPGFKRVAAWAKAEKTVVTMGVICDSLAQPNADDVAWIKANAIENGGVVEFWHHGWDHRSWTDATGKAMAEFRGPDVATQAKHLKDACAIFKQTTGLTFHIFGAPFNQTDDATIAAMDAVPELTLWMYPPKNETKRKVLGRTLNMEVATGKVSYDKFAQDYATKKPTTMMLLQGHCGMWNDASFNAFVKIAALLKQDGWITLTASQYTEKTAKK